MTKMPELTLEALAIEEKKVELSVVYPWERAA